MEFERRICQFTSRPINPKDRASVQILLAQLDSTGKMTEDVEILDVTGSVRASGNIDELLYDYAKSN